MLRPVGEVGDDVARRGRGGGTGPVRGPLRGTLHRRGAQLAPTLGRGDPVFRLLATSAQDPVYHQRHREPAQPGSQGDPQQGAFPQRRGGHETDLPGAEEYHGEVEKSAQGMACCQGAVRDPVRRAIRADGLDYDERLSTQDFLQARLRPQDLKIETLSATIPTTPAAQIQRPASGSCPSWITLGMCGFRQFIAPCRHPRDHGANHATTE